MIQLDLRYSLTERPGVGDTPDPAAENSDSRWCKALPGPHRRPLIFSHSFEYTLFGEGSCITLSSTSFANTWGRWNVVSLHMHVHAHAHAPICYGTRFVHQVSGLLRAHTVCSVTYDQGSAKLSPNNRFPSPFRVDMVGHMLSNTIRQKACKSWRWVHGRPTGPCYYHYIHVEAIQKNASHMLMVHTRAHGSQLYKARNNCIGSTWRSQTMCRHCPWQCSFDFDSDCCRLYDGYVCLTCQQYGNPTLLATDAASHQHILVHCLLFELLQQFRNTRSLARPRHTTYVQNTRLLWPCELRYEREEGTEEVYYWQAGAWGERPDTVKIMNVDEEAKQQPVIHESNAHRISESLKHLNCTEPLGKCTRCFSLSDFVALKLYMIWWRMHTVTSNVYMCLYLVLVCTVFYTVFCIWAFFTRLAYMRGL